VAAIAALVLDKNPGLDPAGVREALVTGAAPRGAAGYDVVFGNGLVDAVGAIEATPPESQSSPKLDWRAANFTVAQLADPALEATVWGDTADPDKDEISNLLEYAMGLDPNSADSAASGAPSVRPQGGALTMIFRRARSATDVDLVVEWSQDLKTWTDQSGSEYEMQLAERLVAENGDIATYEASMAVGAGRRGFVRLTVN